MTTQTATQHDAAICGALPGRGPAFGRKVPGCPRCDELLAGAEPRQLSAHRQAMVDAHASRVDADVQRLADMREHFASAEHRAGRCNDGGPCTKFEW